MWKLVVGFGVGLPIAAALEKLGRCSGNEGEYRACEVRTCAKEECVPCKWSDWSEYGPCTCEGLQERYTNALDTLQLCRNRSSSSRSRLALACDTFCGWLEICLFASALEQWKGPISTLFAGLFVFSEPTHDCTRTRQTPFN